MSAIAAWNDETLVDLAVDRATLGLAPEQAEELGARLRARPELDPDVFERAAALVHLSACGRLEAPPPPLLARLESQAFAQLGLVSGGHTSVARGARGARGARPGPRSTPWLGWVAAAALAVTWLAIELAPWRAPRPEPFVVEPADLLRLPWSPGSDLLSAGVGGEVGWSTERQEGWMRFRSLAPNDPARHQYQLWIFDASRPDWQEHPVDGGVFDVGGGDETTVPIVAKLAIGDPRLFAVTLERPGGVVVSSRERLIVTAATSE